MARFLSNCARIGVRRVPVFGIGLLGLFCCGCTTGKVFTANNLPVALEAPAVENARTLTLTRLAVPPVSRDRVENGDVVEITIAAGLRAEDTTRLSARVGDDGQITLAAIGRVMIGGFDIVDAEAAIAAACRRERVFKRPHVTVVVKQQRKNRITVVGAVKTPGVYEIPRGNCDLIAALVAAGSLSEQAGTQVEIRLPGEKSPAPGVMQASATQTRVVSFDLVSATKKGSGGVRLPDGAVISVETRDPKPIHILGRVRKPGRFELPVGKDVRLLDAIAMAEGVDSQVADKVLVVRRFVDQAEPAVIQLSIAEAKRDGRSNLRLGPGDIVSVEQTTSTIVLDALNSLRFGITGNPFRGF